MPTPVPLPLTLAAAVRAAFVSLVDVAKDLDIHPEVEQSMLDGISMPRRKEEAEEGDQYESTSG